MKKPYRLVLTFISLTLATPLVAMACDLCAIYSSIESAHGSKGSINVGAAYQFTHYESNVRPAGRPELPGQHLESNINQFFIDYNLLNQAAVQLTVPLIYRSYQRIDTTGMVDKGSESGVGDIALMVKYEPYRIHRDDWSFHLELQSGVKLPTGGTDRLKEEANHSEINFKHGSSSGSLVGGDLLTLGTGSFDFVFGKNAFVQYSRFFITSGIQYLVRQEGDYDYQFGNDLYWQLSPGYFISLEHENTLAFKIKFSGESKDGDRLNDFRLAGSSDNRLYLGPQLQYTIQHDWFFQLGADAVVKANDSSEQVTPRYRIMAVALKKF